MKQVKIFLFLFGCAALAPWLCRAVQVSSSLEEKLRYERALEAKGDELLLKVLGPNQARVTVEATLKIEELPGSGKRGEDAAQTRFAWLNAAQKKAEMKELLPGFKSAMPAPSAAPMGEEEAKSYSYKVSKLRANIIAGGQLTQAQIISVTDLMERVLGLDTARGDTLELVRAQFAPAWKTILYSPEYLGILVRYGVVGLVIIVSFIIIGLGIMKMAGAMGQVAKAQEHEISIGFGGEGPGGHGESQPALPAPEGGEKGGKGHEGVIPQEGTARLTFNVRRDQVPLLAGMLRKEEPENISLVVYHLPDEVRGELLSSLGRDLASQVIMKLATVRFVDREMIEEIKQELEKRLDSAVGGVDRAVEMIAPMRYSEKKEIIQQFAACDSRLAAEIRRVIILDEDLLSLDEKGIGMLVSSLPVSQWGEVFPGLPEALRERIKAVLPPKSVQLIEQAMKYSEATREKQDEAVGKFMAVVTELVESGKLPRPLPAVKMIAGTAAAPAVAPAKGAPGRE